MTALAGSEAQTLTDEVALHPETVDAATLRWVSSSAGALGFVGVPAVVPAALRTLLENGTLSGVVVEPGAVLTALGSDRSWRTEGPRVRSALLVALTDPGAWRAPEGSGADDVLAAVVQQVVAGEVGEYVRSHGGDLELVSAVGGAVEVRLSGACTHCPASDLTLSQRVEAAIRARHPGLVSLTATTTGPSSPGTPAPGRRRRLGLLPLRRG